MNEKNKPQVATWGLCVDTDPDNPESDPALICTLDMPLDALTGGLIGVHLAGNMGEATTLFARLACQAIDKVLKRLIERGGDNDTPEMLTGLHIDPNGDLQDGRP